LPSIGLGPSWAVPAWPAVEVTEMGIATALADDMPGQRADAIDALLLAARAIDRQVLERLQGLRGDHTGHRGSRGIDPGVLSVTRRRWGGLFHTACISAGLGHIDPGERGNLQTLCRPALGAVPEHVEAVAVLPACGHDTRIKGQDVLVAWGNYLDKGRAVAADNIHVACKPPRKGFFMIRTVTTQLTERYATWQHQHSMHHVTQKFLLGFLGFYAHQYTIK
jgi:hypothetical protein